MSLGVLLAFLAALVVVESAPLAQEVYGVPNGETTIRAAGDINRESIHEAFTEMFNKRSDAVNACLHASGIKRQIRAGGVNSYLQGMAECIIKEARPRFGKKKRSSADLFHLRNLFRQPPPPPAPALPLSQQDAMVLAPQTRPGGDLAEQERQELQLRQYQQRQQDEEQMAKAIMSMLERYRRFQLVKRAEEALQQEDEDA